MTEPTAQTSFHLRPFVVSQDIAPLLELLAESEAIDKSGEDVSEDIIQTQLTVPHHDPSRDRAVVPHPNKPLQLIAQSALWTAPTAEQQLVSEMSITVHPGWRERGIGSALLQHGLRRAQELHAHYVRLYADPQHTPTVQFLTHRQFTRIAAYTEMRATTTLETPAIPSGFTIKSYTDFQNLPLLVDAFNQSYANLWGHHQVSAIELEQWLPNLELQGLFVLFAPDGSVAGMCRTEQHQQRSERNGKATGYIDAPGIVPRYRTPLMYHVLLAHAVHWLRQQAEVVELESWGDSDEVVSLYQALGFTVLRQQYAYQRSLMEP